ncbi:Zinc finger protein 208 [Chionoecetes opilio]|uniref:Zinc finger protein 208 n=1 Tax=Chionoecetes opilio TaxID=41210 RepID=A0A8J4YLK0_CHIOP|nr:Zinc finger protein 208 [Chionoecetes opilio]
MMTGVSSLRPPTLPLRGLGGHQLVDGSVSVVEEMEEDGGSLKVPSIMSHDGTGLAGEVQYVTTDEAGQSVTAMYPQSSLPLLRTADGNYVNFVELSEVPGELGLDQGGLEADAGMVEFTADGPITVVSADDPNEQLTLLDGDHGQPSVSLAGGDGSQAITYLTAAEHAGDTSPSAILGEQFIQIPASDQSGSTHTITLPLSFLNDGTGVSILQGLSQLQLPLVGETVGDSITLASPVEADHLQASDTQVLSVLQPASCPSAPPLAQPLTSPLPHAPVLHQEPRPPLSKPLVVKTIGQITAKTIHKPHRLIGSGPLAISAQGVLQKIGNRMVTVLPRPEDLKKLQESKSLIVSVKGPGEGDSMGARSPRARRVPVPVRPHQRYGRRGRGGARGRPPSLPKEDLSENVARSISLMKREHPDDSILLAEADGSPDLDLCIKMEDIDHESIVVDMTLPGGSPASAVLVKGPPEDNEFILPDREPPVPVVSRRGRRRKRGRGRPRGTYVISSSGRRPGRPKKVETLVEGPHGARMIHTGPDPRLQALDQELPNIQLSSPSELPNIQLARVDNNDGLQELRVLEMGSLKQEPLEEDPLRLTQEDIPPQEEPVDPTRRRLPPRKRGTRYEKMIQALKKPEYEDEDLSLGEEEDASPDYLTSRRPPPPQRPRGTSGPGKRGRPRKHWPPPPLPPVNVKLEPEAPRQQQDQQQQQQHILGGTLEMESAGHLTPADFSQAEKHNLLITFQQPETGEMVITMLPPPPPSSDAVPSTTTATPTTSVTAPIHIKQDQDQHQYLLDDQYVSDEVAPEGHKCDQCGEVIQFKRDYIRHLRQKHDLRPYECDQCRKTFTSSAALEAHHRVHGLERPHRCDYCGKGFLDPSHLKTHVLTHTGERPHRCHHCFKAFSQASQLKKHLALHQDGHQYRCSICGHTFAHRDTLYTHMKTHTSSRPFVCDICSLGFVTSSGLNRHRKVHKRSSEPTSGVEDEYKCTVCQANFTYKRTLTKHMTAVHGDGSHIKEEEMEIKPFHSELTLVEQLQEQLNEGYAPKTSELYDEPKQSETLESKFPTNPFKCGICEESFTDVDILCDHYTNSHTGDQEVYCDVCSVGCASELQLEQHKHLHVFEEQQSIIHTIPTEEFPFVCNMCGKSFRKHQEFKRHHRSHTQEKNYKCDLCDAGFPLKSALDKHVLVHTGERPFKCDICLKSFRQSAALVRHKLWTHRLKNQNKCELCGKTFFTPTLLTYHLDSHGDAGQSAKSRLAELAEDEVQLLEQPGEARNEANRPAGKEGHQYCEYCGKSFPSYVSLLTHKLTHKLNASYKCDVCHRTFREKRYLQKHKLTHKGVKSWKCDICKKAFATKLTLIRHSHVHLREALRPGPGLALIPEEGEEGDMTGGSTLPAVLKCDDCGIDFAHKSHYVRHKLLHSGTPLLKCGLCNKLFVHKSDIIRHKVMHSFMFTCDVCGRNFHKRSLFLMHKRKHVDDKPFKCHCGKSFSTSGNYNTHKRIHSGEKPYKCDMCDYRCSQSGRLLKHKRMHSGVKPFPCETCGKYFANAETAKVHKRIHTGERPFKCGNCGKTFINNSSLNLHMRDHIREEMFKCDVCSHKFRREHHLEKHRQFHTMEQQQYHNTTMGIEAESSTEAQLYMCDICGRVFDKKKYLYTHQNVHSRQRHFPCNYCGKPLASRLALKNHNLIHTGEMPYKCITCGKEFRSSSNLKRHERTHSGQDPAELRCDTCDETFHSLDDLNQHKASHMQGMMMVDPTVEAVTDNPHHLYVFEAVREVGEAMDSTPQLLVDNNQQQFLVDGSQPLLVFPEASAAPYPELSEEPEPDPDPVEEDPGQQPDVIMVPEKLEEQEEKVVEKPFKCDVCHKSFAKKQYLTKHKYRHREVKPHACDVCHKRFAQKFEVAVHKIKHTGERPYQCDVCGKPFRSKVNLLHHKMRHTGEYPFLCSICNKGFSTQLQLERHVTLHTGSHPYKCNICQRGYTQRTNLMKHLAKSHDINDPSQIDATNSMENAEAVENMESMEVDGGVDTTILEEAGGQVTVEEEAGQAAIAMEADLLGNEEEHTAYSVVEVHPDYLKDYLLTGSQVVATHEMDPKLLQSILQQVRGGPAVVHVNAID